MVTSKVLCLFVHLYIRLSTCLFASLFLSVYLFFKKSFCLPIYIYLSASPFLFHRFNSIYFQNTLFVAFYPEYNPDSCFILLPAYSDTFLFFSLFLLLLVLMFIYNLLTLLFISFTEKKRVTQNRGKGELNKE